VTSLGDERTSAGLRPGDHVCALHFGPRQRQKLLLRLVEDGLAAGQRCICRVGPADARVLLSRFGTDGRVAADGDLLVVERRRDPSGKGPTRLLTDLASLPQEQGPCGPIRGQVRGEADVIVCLGDVEHLDLNALVDLCARHPKVVLGRRAIPGLWSVPARGRLAAGGAGAEPGSGDGGGDGPPVQEGILVMSSLMYLTGHEREVGTLAERAVDALGSLQWQGMVVVGRGWHGLAPALRRRADTRAAIEAQLRVVGPHDGPLSLPGEAWSWGFSLGRPDGSTGHLVVSADAAPPADDLFLVRLTAQLAGNAVTHLRARDRTRVLRGELERTQNALETTAELLDWCTVVRERLHEVVVARSGPQGIALAIHDMTGQTVEIEDRDGRCWARAGATESVNHRVAGTGEGRRWLLDRARRAGGPFWHDGDLIVPAHSGEDVVGLLVVVDADRDLAEGELLALEDGATLVALELAHVREVAEVEGRLGRDLLNELLDGRDPVTVSSRALALGCDMDRTHQVVLLEPRDPHQLEAFGKAVRRVVRASGAGPLLTFHENQVAVLARVDADWEALRASVAADPGGGPCRVALGAPCTEPGDIPRSLRQAQLGLRLQEVLGGEDRVTAFEQLGIYRLLAELAEVGGVERYIQEWLQPLQPLLDYDEAHRSELVETLSAWVEWGGRQDATARALSVHRSTLKYRLQRIRAISGWDINDPEILFNLQLATRALRTLAALTR
jgi:sugar diacid utilization regulator